MRPSRACGAGSPARLGGRTHAVMDGTVARPAGRQMEEAAGYGGPTREQLAELQVPMGVAGAVDDAVHPVAVAAEWAGSRAADRHPRCDGRRASARRRLWPHCARPRPGDGAHLLGARSCRMAEPCSLRRASGSLRAVAARTAAAAVRAPAEPVPSAEPSAGWPRCSSSGSDSRTGSGLRPAAGVTTTNHGVRQRGSRLSVMASMVSGAHDDTAHHPPVAAGADETHHDLRLAGWDNGRIRDNPRPHGPSSMRACALSLRSDEASHLLPYSPPVLARRTRLLRSARWRVAIQTAFGTPRLLTSTLELRSVKTGTSTPPRSRRAASVAGSSKSLSAPRLRGLNSECHHKLAVRRRNRGRPRHVRCQPAPPRRTT